MREYFLHWEDGVSISWETITAESDEKALDVAKEKVREHFPDITDEAANDKCGCLRI